jgi:hypothetical protein
MMKFVFAAALVAAVAVAVFATDISLVECSDGECKTGCKAIAKFTAGECHGMAFSHNRSFEATTLPAVPGALCVYGAIFNKNATNPAASCASNNVRSTALEPCNTCFQSKHTGMWTKISGCDKPGNLTIASGCTPMSCTTCRHTFTVPEKTCVSPSHLPFSLAFGAPSPCPGRIATRHYNDSETCSGWPQIETFFSKACYSRGCHMGRCASHYYLPL